MPIKKTDEPKRGRGAAFQNAAPSESTPEMMSKQRVKVEFARRLNRLMITKGWNQSELARRSQLKAADGVKMTRDKISKYIAGEVLPNPVHLDALCQALGCAPIDLIPVHGAPEAGDNEGIMHDLGDGTVWLRIEQAVDKATALKVMGMLWKEEK